MKKRALSFLLALCVFVSIGQTAMAYSTVRTGSRGADVKTLQTMLNTVANAKLGVDGIFGTNTRNAVRKFQSANGLSVDGICGPKTWAKLTAQYNAAVAPPSATPSAPSTSYPMVQNGSRGSAVRTLQTMLNALQGAGLKVDGIFGSGTKAAVIKFQRANSLSADGICGPKTWAALVARYNGGTSVSSSITIGAGNYTPGNLVRGKTYSISGVVSSAKTLSSVTIGIYYSDGSATASIRTVYPRSTSYNIHDSDSYIRFGVLSAGSYSFRVSATDVSGYTKTLVNNSFTVSSETNSTNLSASDINSVLGCKQHRNSSGEGICTSCATVTLLRRKQFLDGKAVTFNIEDVRASLGAPFSDIMRSVIFNADGTYWRDTYSVRNGNNTTYHTVIEGSRKLNMGTEAKKRHIATLLQSHPEGIVAFCKYGNGGTHAIVISDYNVTANGGYQFYAYDPATTRNGSSYRTTLENTMLRGRCGTTNKLIDNVFNIWYIS